MRGHLGPWDVQLYCINLLKDHQAVLHTQFQASEPSDSKGEDSLNIFLCISMV